MPPRVIKTSSTELLNADAGGKSGVRRKANEESDGGVVSSKRQKMKFSLSVPKLSNITGTVLTCGQGDMGQLGLGEDEMEKKRPTALSSIKDIVLVSAGGMHNLCLTKDGDIYSFGCNDEGALGRDTSEEGSEFNPAKIDLPGKAVQISAGDSHSACLLEDGRVFAWGSFRNSHGNMGLTFEGNKRSPIQLVPQKTHVQIASGADHLVMLNSTGSVYTVGCAEQGQLGRISMRSASGDSRRGNTQILKPDIILLKWKNIEKIWTTTYCTFLKVANSDIILGFGLNNYKQLAIPKDLQVVSTPMIIEAFKNVEKIAGGQHHTLVLTKDKKVYAIGRHDYGRLGLGKLTQDLTELKCIEKLKNIVDISAGEAQSFAIDSKGKVYAWGMGSSLQLGTGLEDDAIEPVLIDSKQTQKEIIAATGGGQHSIFLIKNDGNNNNSTAVTEDAPKKGRSKETSEVKELPKENGVVEESNSELKNESKEESSENEDIVMSAEVKIPIPKAVPAVAKRGRKKK